MAVAANEMADAGPDTRLFVWAPARLRAAAEHAIELWNTAMGREVLAFTPTRSDAKVHIMLKMPPGSDGAPNRFYSGEADIGGKDAKGVLRVWINPADFKDGSIQGTSYPGWVVTHELGHSLGLDDAYMGRMNKTPSAEGIMSKSTAPGPTEGEQALGAQGLGQPFNWSPEAQADYQGAGVSSSTNYVAQIRKDYEAKYNLKDPAWRTALSLVTSGLTARGATSESYPKDQLPRDVGLMWQELHLPAKPSAPPTNSGGSGNTRSM